MLTLFDYCLLPSPTVAASLCKYMKIITEPSSATYKGFCADTEALSLSTNIYSEPKLSMLSIQ